MVRRYIVAIVSLMILSSSSYLKGQSNSSDTLQSKVLTEAESLEFEYLFVEGVKQRTFGDANRAVTIFNRCIEIDPNSAASLAQLASIYMSAKDPVNATTFMERAVAISPQNSYYPELLAQIYQQSGKYIESADIYLKLAQESDDRLDYLYQAATLFSEGKEFQKAIDTYDTLELKTGINEGISLGKQKAYVGLDNIKGAEKEIQKLIDSDPKRTEYYGIMADLYLHSGESDKALKYYNKVLKMDPEDGFIHVSLLNYYMSLSDTVQAYEHLRVALSNKELNIDTKIQVFSTVARTPSFKIDNAYELSKLIMDSAPDNDKAIALYASILISDKKLPEGRESLIKAIEINPQKYIYREQLIFLESQMMLWDEVTKSCRDAISLFPNNPILYLMGASGNIQLKSNDIALNLLDSGEVFVQNNIPLKAQFNLHRGEAYYHKDELDSAWLYFDESIKIDPTNWLALNNYAYYLSEKGVMLEKAERLITQVIQNNPNNSTFLDTYAWILFKKEDYTLAKFYMKSALDSSEEPSLVLLEHYGDILYFLDKKDEAKSYWQKALDGGADSSTLKEKVNTGIYKE